MTGARCVQHLLETDRRLVGRRTQLAQADVLNGDVDLVRRGVRQEGFDDATLVVLGDRGVGERRLQEQQRLRVLALNRRPQATEVLHDELREEVAELRGLWPVGGGVVLHRFRASDFIDADNERLDLSVFRRGVEVQSQQAQGDERYQYQGDLQVRVHYQRRAVQLDKLAFRTLQRLRVEIRDRHAHGKSS